MIDRGRTAPVCFLSKEEDLHFEYHCHDCGCTFTSDEVVYLCPECSGTEAKGEFRKGVLSVEYDRQELRRLAQKDDLCIDDFLPFPIVTPQVFPTGPTPLVRPLALSRELGLDLTVKMDSQLLSGSFKDRASILVASQAIHHGTSRIALASTGNAGAAMSAIGAAYGLDIVLFVPASAPVNKLMQSVLYNAHVVPVRGSYDDAFALSIAYTERKGGINRNTAYNPMTIEGKKACSIELFLQLGRRAPDVIYVPTGDGCILGGIYKGFYDLLQAGLIERLPRIICCQSSRSDAIASAFESGQFWDVTASTLADSISVSSPANGRMAVRALRESGGYAVRVEDEEILEAQRQLAAKAGLFVEPASAAAWAALLRDRKNIAAGESVTVLLTGTGFKDMAVFNGRISLPEAISCDVKELDKLDF